MFRQGDILLVKAEAHEGEKLESLVIQEGEVTGHAHRIADPDTAALFGVNGIAEFVVVSQPAEIVHEDHDTVNLEAGIYRVIRQREYSPKANRRVLD